MEVCYVLFGLWMFLRSFFISFAYREAASFARSNKLLLSFLIQQHLYPVPLYNSYSSITLFDRLNIVPLPIITSRAVTFTPCLLESKEKVSQDRAPTATNTRLSPHLFLQFPSVVNKLFPRLDISSEEPLLANISHWPITQRN